MEYLDIYNEKKEKLNKKVKRGDKILDNEHILVTVIFIENSEGELLIQKTSKNYFLLDHRNYNIQSFL